MAISLVGRDGDLFQYKHNWYDSSHNCKPLNGDQDHPSTEFMDILDKQNTGWTGLDDLDISWT